MTWSTHASENAARAVIARIDTALGYPKMEQGEIGPPVWTETHTQPIELTDGTWAVQLTEEIRGRMANPPALLKAVDVAKIKQRPDPA